MVGIRRFELRTFWPPVKRARPGCAISRTLFHNISPFFWFVKKNFHFFCKILWFLTQKGWNCTNLITFEAPFWPSERRESWELTARQQGQRESRLRISTISSRRGDLRWGLQGDSLRCLLTKWRSIHRGCLKCPLHISWSQVMLCSGPHQAESWRPPPRRQFHGETSCRRIRRADRQKRGCSRQMD